MRSNCDRGDRGILSIALMDLEVVLHTDWLCSNSNPRNFVNTRMVDTPVAYMVVLYKYDFKYIMQLPQIRLNILCNCVISNG